MAERLKPIRCSSQPLGMSFHPQSNLLASGIVNGHVEIHKYHTDSQDWSWDNITQDQSLIYSSDIHNSKSCRCVRFDNDGNTLYTAGRDSSICGIDVSRSNADSTASLSWRISDAHPNGINKLFQLPPTATPGPLLATGDDEGCIRLWDTRLCTSTPTKKPRMEVPRSCVGHYSIHSDYISSFAYRDNRLFATSGDCTLSVCDVRKPGILHDTAPAYRDSPLIQSDDAEDEFLSLEILKHGEKIICGTQTGALAIYTRGKFEDMSDRFPGHPSSVDAMVKVDEDTLLTGSADGVIRMIQIHPNKLIGVLGRQEDGFPVEGMEMSRCGGVLASFSHDDFVRFWDVSMLKDDDEEEVECEDEPATKRSKISSNRKTVRESDDEWDDMDDDVTDSTSDEDSDDEKKPAERRFKTENEKFFEDL